MRNKRERGSVTVEMTIVFPIVFLTIVGMIYMSIVKYQNIVTATAAMQTAARAAANWNTIGGNPDNGDAGWYTREYDGIKVLIPRPNYSEHDPYGSILDLRSANREKNTADYMSWIMSGNPEIFDDAEITGTPTADKSGLLQKYITVSIKKTYINPLGNLLESVGIASRESRTITAKAPLNTPTEFIRNVSYIMELVRESKK
jgi:hypothetical protein